jgi:hypothetical protein
MPNIQKPKQRDRILAILAIEPRSVAMLEARTRIDRRRVNKIIAELRATGKHMFFDTKLSTGNISRSTQQEIHQTRPCQIAYSAAKRNLRRC